ncbi:AbrB/MazE/SpoVT family DNA-binding domain-containing protein [Biomaibacter acetigenes]|uniref:AbrB/MazE/SpoVT family DNA-binding domain-containing protein n=1 Tax=Biomaibacter acetigenes TaxID=2316383 RepID=A0A3G2R2N1_9FIRM|nr:AbrB/MazE/SpoVT family DNA-binding domain-containing protein [Biomaibacter acetigenes]AYO29700.1 AbrB/MazE/SpoVT family DNA-binding domain-containing protein [Biomaibacter acetigenes]
MITKLRERSQITLPAEIIKKMKLAPGDTLEITIEDDKIVIKPVLIVDRSQAWFWSKKWQEKEVEEDIKAGRVYHAKDIDDLIKQLES